MIGAPSSPWLFQVVGPAVWVLVAAFFARQIYRDRTVSIPALIFFAGTTMWWLEWYADWSAYMVYNHRFALIPWGSTRWASPYKPWAVIAGYGWFIGLSLAALAAGLRRQARTRSDGTRSSVSFWTVLAVVLPAYWLFDAGVEAAASAMNWWRYLRPGPLALHTGSAHFSLVYPVLPFALWAVVAVWLLAQRDDRGFLLHERVMRVHHVRGHVAAQAARLGAMALVLNLSYLVVMVLPLWSVRMIGDWPKPG